MGSLEEGVQVLFAVVKPVFGAIEPESSRCYSEDDHLQHSGRLG